MLPRDLTSAQFAAYPTEARKLAVAHLDALRQLPMSFAPSLLREMIDYDFKFPAERTAIERELDNLSSLSASQMKDWFRAFSGFSISPKLEQSDWVNHPGQYVEQLSAYLWTTHQLDDFRKAATEYGNRLQPAAPPERISQRRLGIAVVGQGVASYDAPLFQKLRKHGTYFSRVKPDNGLDILLAGVAERAKANPLSYGHWYVDGGRAVDHSQSLTCVSYHALQPVLDALLRRMNTEIGQPGMGPEELRTYLARLSPSDLGMDKQGDPVMDRFQVRLFTEGSGTQIFSTTFAQWTAREALRRAQPSTLLVRFAPRQQQKPMNELLAGSGGDQLDLIGSLIDADMGAYYHWLNQKRLPGAEQSSFLVWFEGHQQALAIAPSIPRGSRSDTEADLGQLLSWVAT